MTEMVYRVDMHDWQLVLKLHVYRVDMTDNLSLSYMSFALEYNLKGNPPRGGLKVDCNLKSVKKILFE